MKLLCKDINCQLPLVKCDCDSERVNFKGCRELEVVREWFWLLSNSPYGPTTVAVGVATRNCARRSRLCIKYANATPAPLGARFFTRKGSSRSQKPIDRPPVELKQFSEKYIHHDCVKMVFPTIYDGKVEVWYLDYSILVCQWLRDSVCAVVTLTMFFTPVFSCFMYINWHGFMVYQSLNVYYVGIDWLGKSFTELQGKLNDNRCRLLELLFSLHLWYWIVHAKCWSYFLQKRFCLLNNETGFKFI